MKNLALFAILAAPSSAVAHDWEEYRSKGYGFSMPVPVGTKFKEKEWKGGWGGLHANYQGIKLWGVAKLGTYASRSEIEKLGIHITGLPENYWQKLDKGTSRDGWTWYRTVKVTTSKMILFGGYGVGLGGSYLLLLQTTRKDFNKYRSEYESWYDRVKLHPVEFAGQDWTVYDAPKYGYTMLAPRGTKLKEREWDSGWAGLQGNYKGIEFFGTAKLNTDTTAAEIEEFGVRLTGLAEDYWEQIDQGKSRAGWKWYRTVRASDGKVVVFGGYGLGPKGGYLLLLRTTVADYKKHEADYKKWYRSVTLR